MKKGKAMTFFFKRSKTLKKYNVTYMFTCMSKESSSLDLIGWYFLKFQNEKFRIDAIPVWDVVFWNNRSCAAFELVDGIRVEVNVKFLSTKCSEDQVN